MTAETLTPDGGRLALKPAQETALAALERGTLSDLTRAAYEEITGVSRSQAAYDLADLVRLGLLERVGTGRATRYRLARGAGGRPRKWTEERIHAELESFCAEIGRWPRAVEFRDAGRGDLYLAASRYGGIDHWAAALGLREAAAGKPAPAGRPSGKPAAARRANGRRAPARVEHDNPAPAGRAAAAAAVGRAARAYGRDRGHSLLAGAIVVSVVTFAGLLFLADRDQRDGITKQARSVGAGTPLGLGGVTEPALIESATDTRLTLRLTAVRASSWIAVRRGSAGGRVLFEGTLATGQSLRFQGQRIWLRVGAPAGLRARLDGRSLTLPDQTSTLLVRKGGLRVLDLEAPAPPPAEEAVVVSQPVVYTPPSSEPSEAGTASSSPPPTPDASPSPDPRPPGADPDPPKSD